MVVRRLNAISGIHCHAPKGAFYVFPSCTDLMGRCTAEGRRVDNSNDFVLYLLDTEGLARACARLQP